MGGRARLDAAYVNGEGEPYRPEMILWVSTVGAILGHAVGRPGEAVAMAAQSLRDTVAHPMVGRPHAPQRVRVASTELAAALRGAIAGLDVVCAPTPEIDAVFGSMREAMTMRDDAEIEQTYLTPDIGPEAVGAFFRAAAGLFRAAPWTIVPGDEDLFSVTIESLNVRDAVVSVIGQMGQSHGFVVFSSFEDFEAYLDAADAMEHGEAPTMMPRHFALNFGRGADLGAGLRKEIATRGWEVAGPSAYPRLVAIDGDLVARPGSAREMTIAEAISLALTRLLREEKALRAAWTGGAPVQRAVSVQTHAGDLVVALRVPPPRHAVRSAAERLEAALSDSTNFGMAKSFFMSGREAGFDMGLKGGDRVVDARDGGPAAAGVGSPAAGGPAAVAGPA